MPIAEEEVKQEAKILKPDDTPIDAAVMDTAPTTYGRPWLEIVKSNDELLRLLREYINKKLKLTNEREDTNKTCIYRTAKKLGQIVMTEMFVKTRYKAMD